MHSFWEDSRSRVTANIQNDTYQVLIVPSDQSIARILDPGNSREN